MYDESCVVFIIHNQYLYDITAYLRSDINVRSIPFNLSRVQISLEFEAHFVHKKEEMLKFILIAGVFFTVVSSNEENLQKFVERNKWFAAAAYKQTLKQKIDRNFVICPFSAETVLALAQTGAKGKTRQEIRNALHLPNSTEEINGIFKTLLTNLKKNQGYTLHTANKIYLKEDYRIKERFEKTATEVFESSVENVDFTQKKQAANAINSWVARRTEDKIQNLIDSDSLDEDTVAILVNALYLQATWRKNFKKVLTRKQDFYKDRDEVIQVETMKKTDDFGFYENDELDAKYLQIQFKGGRSASLVVVLPNEKQGLKKLEGRIEEIYRLNFNWELIDVALPKFKIETGVDFKKILKKLGVKKAFTRADFSAMAGERGDIHVTDVVQKTYIDVNEYGVEAAAATAVFYHPKSLVEHLGERKSFVADHPFLFYILVDNIVMFTGRVVDPSV